MPGNRVSRGAGPVRVSAHGPCPPDQVWMRYVTRAQWPTWAPHIRRVEPSGAVIAAGDEGVVRGPLGLRVNYQILVRDDARRRWAWRVGLGPVRVLMEHGVEVMADQTGGRVGQGPGEHATSGSLAWVDLHLPRPVTAAYTPLARRALRRLTH